MRENFEAFLEEGVRVRDTGSNAKLYIFLKFNLKGKIILRSPRLHSLPFLDIPRISDITANCSPRQLILVLHLAIGPHADLEK